ncbi:MAG TPA: metalloregulator ArsR/SmtB family transcription factor [Sphingomicrobium sp.]|nr:metalloregulator ArsR/SmtB family transcription factor [Sphingomicrobium sp.]
MLNDSQLDQAFAALSDPTRRAMLGRLSRGPASVSELASPLRMSLPAVLQHLKALEASGLVRSQKRGRVRTVAMAPDALSRAEEWLGERRREWEALHDRFDAYVSTLNSKGDS